MLPRVHDGVWVLTRLPWVIPGLLGALIMSIVGSGPMARWLGVRRFIGWVLLMSCGVILAGTLTPLGYAYRQPARTAQVCDLSRFGWPDLADLTRPTDVLLNILMFVPLGFAIGLAPRSSRKRALCVGALLLPFAIEITQLSATPLGRSCQSADVIDNLTGLLLGAVAGTLIERLAPGTQQSPGIGSPDRSS